MSTKRPWLANAPMVYDSRKTTHHELVAANQATTPCSATTTSVHQNVDWLGPMSDRISGWALRICLVRLRCGSGALECLKSSAAAVT